MKFVFILTILLILSLSSCKNIIGLNPAYQHQYEGNSFKCDSDQKEIPINWVNDNYCDCKDGSDEPGTSACSNGRFYCKNEKFHPHTIPSQWANDGICDCCDGSDEYTTNSCKDTCKNELRKEYDSLLKEIKSYKASLQTKNEWIQYGKNFRDKMSQEDTIKKSIEKLDAELTVLTQKLQDIKMLYNDIDDEASIHDKINFFLSKTLHNIREFFSFVIPTELSRLNDKVREHQHNKTRDKDILEKIGKLKEEHYGPDDVLLKLVGKIYSFSDGRHSYSLFPFNSAKQSTTSLGKWSGWKDKTTMYYDGGDVCPNGEKRTSSVKIVCREKDGIISIEEPTACTYNFVLGLPSECTEEKLKQLEEKARKYKF